MDRPKLARLRNAALRHPMGNLAISVATCAAGLINLVIIGPLLGDRGDGFASSCRLTLALPPDSLRNAPTSHDCRPAGDGLRNRMP